MKLTVLLCCISAILACGHAGTLEEDRADYWNLTAAEVPKQIRAVELSKYLPLDVNDGTVRALVEQLGHETPRMRRNAHRDLEATGIAALEALSERTDDEDPEIRLSCLELIEKIRENTRSDSVIVDLISQKERGGTAMSLKEMGTILSEERTSLHRDLFALRQIVPPGDLINLFERLSDRQRVEERNWFLLLGHTHGRPLLQLSRNVLRDTPFYKQEQFASLKLTAEQLAFLLRGADSEYIRLRHHCRKWLMTLEGVNRDEWREDALRGNDLALRRFAVRLLRKDNPERLEAMVNELDMEAAFENPGPECFDALALISVLVAKREDDVTKQKSIQEYLDMASTFLGHKDPAVRRAAAIAMVPERITFSRRANSTTSISLDSTLFGTSLSTNLIAGLIEHIETGKTERDFRSSTYGEPFRDAVKDALPEDMALVLKIFLRDIPPDGEAYEETVVGLYEGLFLNRFASGYAPNLVRSRFLGALLDNELHQYSSSLSIYTAAFASPDMAELLSMQFAHGRVPKNCGYGVSAAKLLENEPDTLRKALDSGFVHNRIEAAYALARLEDQHLGLAAKVARTVIQDPHVQTNLRVFAAVTLGRMDDATSLPAMRELEKDYREFHGAELDNYQQGMVLFDLLVAQSPGGPEQNPDLEARIRERLGSTACPVCGIDIAKNSCYQYYYESYAYAILAHKWQLKNLEVALPPADNETRDATIRNTIGFLLNPKQKIIPGKLYSLFRLPKRESLYLHEDIARRIDELTGETSFADVAAESADEFWKAYAKWKKSDAADPFVEREDEE